MLQTLFYLPHEILGWPVFGWGWAVLAWGVFAAVLMLRLVRQQGFNADTRSYLPVLVIVAAALVFLLPRMEVVEGDLNLGVPIRGYGVMLLLGVVAGVGLAAWRARQVGLDPEVIFSLAFVMFVSGIVGARAFYVIEYWDQFAKPTLPETVVAILNVAQGGLVVYGSLLAVLVAIVLFVRIKRLPGLALADLIAPSMALGLALGRVGCLLNGCCFGGLCDHPWAVTFPAARPPYQPYDSPPYEHQKRLGLLQGIHLAADQKGAVVISAIDPHGPASRAGLHEQDRVVAINRLPVQTLDQALQLLDSTGPNLELRLADGRTAAWQLPPRSLPVHPTQLYAAINGGLLCLLTLAYFPFRRRDGEVLALLLGLYGLTRFLEEVIRDDEGSFLGTGLTVSQNVSLAMIVLAVLISVYILRREKVLTRQFPSYAGGSLVGRGQSV